MPKRQTLADRIKKVHYYSVRGTGSFPVDMLRYDWMFISPTTRDAIEAQEKDWHSKLTLPIVVADPLLKGYVDAGPTDGRWRSFLWSVVAIDEPDQLLADDWLTWRDGKWLTFGEWKTRPY